MAAATRRHPHTAWDCPQAWRNCDGAPLALPAIPSMPDGGGHAHVGAREPMRDGVVHALVREHFAAFAEQMQEGGRSLPRYVVAEFEAFVRCGVLACGVMR